LVWEEWGRVTRFLESSRYTLLQAARRWDEVANLDVTNANLEIEMEGTTYRVSVGQHVAALSDMWCLYSSALMLYFALAETAAAERLGFEDLVGCNGIEDWAGQLLAAAGVEWRCEEERLGLVEIGVVRNLIAHGERQYSRRAVARLSAAGLPKVPSVGDRVLLDYATLKLYRSRLRSFLNLAGLGAAAVEQAHQPDGQQVD
jgi:hypothetical protein